MLEHVPQWLGKALRGVRAGTDKLVIAQESLGSFGEIPDDFAESLQGG